MDCYLKLVPIGPQTLVNYVCHNYFFFNFKQSKLNFYSFAFRFRFKFAVAVCKETFCKFGSSETNWSLNSLHSWSRIKISANTHIALWLYTILTELFLIEGKIFEAKLSYT